MPINKLYFHIVILELRLDERSVPAEEISLQPVGSDYADNPYASTSHQGYGRVSIVEVGVVVEVEVVDNPYASTTHQGYGRVSVVEVGVVDNPYASTTHQGYGRVSVVEVGVDHLYLRSLFDPKKAGGGVESTPPPSTFSVPIPLRKLFLTAHSLTFYFEVLCIF